MYNSRSVIQLSSKKGVSEVINFLQGLITNDISESILETSSVYTFMLNANGKYNFDFFIIKVNENIYIDVHSNQADDLISKLKFYKLILKINIEKQENLNVCYNTDTNQYIAKYNDSRHEELPSRFIIEGVPSKSLSEEEYNEIRYSNSVLEGEDFIFDKSIPIECGADELGAISYNKGCYLGQEFTNSAKHRMVIRNRVVSIPYTNAYNENVNIITNLEEEKVGTVLKVVGNYLVCRLNISKIENTDIYYSGNKLSFKIPSWIKIYNNEKEELPL